MESRLPENVAKGVKGESIQARLKRAVNSVKDTFSEAEKLTPSTINVAKERYKTIEKDNGHKVESINHKRDTEGDWKMSEVTESVQNIQVDPQPSKVSKLTPLAKNLSVPKQPTRKYESSLPVRDQLKDKQGFFKVIVTNFDPLNSVYSVILESNQIATLSNQMIMNTDYESNGIPFVNLNELKGYKSLIMALVNGNWLRCKVLIRNEIYLKDIDSGKKYNLTLGNYPLKYPLERELIVNAFAYNVQFTNEHTSGITIGDKLKIRLIDENYFGILKAEIFFEEPQIEKTRNEAAESDEIPRFLIDKMKAKNLPLGPQKLMLLDGKNIKNGKIHIALSSADSENFYDFLYDRINEYIELNQDMNQYKPM